MVDIQKKLIEITRKNQRFFNLRDRVRFQHINPSTTNVPHHTETSQLICNVNQLTGFYMMGNIDR